MKPARLLLPCLITLLLNANTSASKTLNQFYNQIIGKWYVTQWHGGITGETINYDPLPADSVIISRINGTDSIRIIGYNNSQLLSNDKFRVLWSINYNDWQLSSNGSEIPTKLLPGFLKIFQTENVTTFNRIESYVFSGNIGSAATMMQGRWYLTAIGSELYEMEEYPSPGDSIIVSIKETVDSIQLSYYQNCRIEHSDQYRLVIDSSWSLQTDALMLVNDSEINRIVVMVTDTNMILKTDSMPGHYLVLLPIDTFTFYKAPFISSVTGDSACVSSDLALQAESDPGEIRWYTDLVGGIPIAHGNIFFPNDITQTTTYYVDAISHECVTNARTPVVAVINQVPEITTVTGGERCGEGHVVLLASSSGGDIYWYTDSLASIAVATGNSYETPELSSNTVYYVDAGLNGCFSERLPVTATISYNDTCSLTASLELPDENIIVFPDPTSGKFEIRFPENLHPKKIVVCNTSGIALKKLFPTGYPLSMDISELPVGLYFIILHDDSSVRALKIIKH
ncbi:MAG TPA: T9SS type A sorting domain-containing protein [Bacteroidales bacterium]|nr:T9SS type A sorting domain-containing protein [Bacteroidales bacterium]